MKKVVVSEYVSFGHPDKIADQIADALLDAYLMVDPETRSGIEVLIKDSTIVLGGEVKSNAIIDHESVVLGVMETFNFSDKHHLQPENLKIINLIGKQSPEINKGVEKGDNVIGAGDQGFMVGYASNKTPNYLPLGVYLSKVICQYISEYFIGVGPDTKSQVIVDYSNETPVVKHILVSTMHTCSLETIKEIVTNNILSNWIDIDEKIFNKYIKYNKDLIIDVNPCGSWEIGGPVADCGVTGRKIVVDQYGGYCNVGGGAFSGKDGESKVDRSGAYMARYISKNIVAAGISDTCKITLSYIIGVPEPSSINIETEPSLYTDIIERFIRENIDLTPNGISNKFELTNPIYYKTARYGHFGNESYPWEKLDLVDALKKEFIL